MSDPEGIENEIPEFLNTLNDIPDLIDRIQDTLNTLINHVRDDGEALIEETPGFNTTQRLLHEAANMSRDLRQNCQNSERNARRLINFLQRDNRIGDIVQILDRANIMMNDNGDLLSNTESLFPGDNQAFRRITVIRPSLESASTEISGMLTFMRNFQ